MLDRIIPGSTVLLRQAGMRCLPAHPSLAPLRAIDHLRQVFVQNASLRESQSYGDQWLRTIPPAASRLLQSAVGKQLRQETWDKHIAAERILEDCSHALPQDLRQLVFIGGDVVDKNLKVALPGLDYILACLPMVILKSSNFRHTVLSSLSFHRKPQNFHQ